MKERIENFKAIVPGYEVSIRQGTDNYEIYDGYDTWLDVSPDDLDAVLRALEFIETFKDRGGYTDE